jgi:hypothetical protein
VLLGAITLDLMAVLFGGAIALLPAIAEPLGTDAVGLGLLARRPGSARSSSCSGWPAAVERRVGRSSGGRRRLRSGPRPRPDDRVRRRVWPWRPLRCRSISVFIRSSLVPLASPVRSRARPRRQLTRLNELGAFESGSPAGSRERPGGGRRRGRDVAIVGAYAYRFPARDLDRYPAGRAPPGRFDDGPRARADP